MSQDHGLAAVWHGRDDVRIEPLVLPDLLPGQLLVQVIACGICGSDLHVLDGKHPLSFKPPRVLGHELVGNVAEVGPGVTSFLPGDAITWEPTVPCTVCGPCRDGHPLQCESLAIFEGGFGQFAVAPTSAAVRLPRDLDPVVGVLAEPLSCALHAFKRAGVGVGDDVVVIGGGPIGLLLTLLARRGGARRVFVIEPVPIRRAAALALGASDAFDPAREDIGERVLQATGGRGAHVVFEAVGASSTVSLAVKLAKRAGTVVLAGVPPEHELVALDAYQILLFDLTVRGAYVRSFTFQRAVELLPTIPAEVFLTHEVVLQGFNEGVALARNGQAVKVVVRPHGL